MRNWTAVNINDYIKVKLTERGIFLWHQYLSQLLNKMPEQLEKKLSKSFSDLKEEADLEGFHEFQIWELMSIFGNHCYNGCEIPFETDVLIEQKSLPTSLQTETQIHQPT